jgi:hypothetical protein
MEDPCGGIMKSSLVFVYLSEVINKKLMNLSQNAKMSLITNSFHSTTGRQPSLNRVCVYFQKLATNRKQTDSGVNRVAIAN